MKYILRGIVLLVILCLLPFVGGLIQWLTVFLILLFPIALVVHIYTNCETLIHDVQKLFTKG